MLKCNQCGKSIKQGTDIEPPLRIKHSFGYHSKRDLEKLDIALCSDCTESLTEYLITKCVINPVVETVAV